MNRNHASPQSPSSEPGPAQAAAAVAQTRLVHLALTLGVVMFGVVAVVGSTQGWFVGGAPDAEPSALGELLPLLGIAALVTLVPAAFVLRSAMRARVPRGAGEQVRIAAFRASSLLFVGIVEAAALLNITALLLVPDPRINGATAAIALAIMLTSVPTRDSFDQLGR